MNLKPIRKRPLGCTLQQGSHADPFPIYWHVWSQYTGQRPIVFKKYRTILFASDIFGIERRLKEVVYES